MFNLLATAIMGLETPAERPVLVNNTGFSKSVSNVNIVLHPHPICFSTAVKWWYICFKMKFQFQHMIFKQITKNCQTQSSMIRVENHAAEIKNYVDGNEM